MVIFTHAVLAFLSLQLTLLVYFPTCIFASADGTQHEAQHPLQQDRPTQDLLDEAQKYMLAGKTADALRAFDQAIAQDPQNYLSRYKRAMVLVASGRDGAALEDLDAVLQMRPDFEQALTQRAKVHMKRCGLDAAKRDLDTLEKRGSPSADLSSLREQVDASLRAQKQADSLGSPSQSNAEQLISHLDTLIKSCSHDPSLRTRRAEAFEVKGDYAQAIGDYTRAVALQPDSIPILRQMAQLQMKLGEVDAAVGSLKSCLHLDPEHGPCVKLVKKLKKLTKGLEKAEGLVTRGQLRNALGPDGLDLDRSQANGVLKMMDDLKVKGAFGVKVYGMICDVTTKLKRHDDAIKWCSQVLELDPDHVEMLCNRGDMYLGKDDFEAALRDYNKAKEVSGGHPPQRVMEGIQKAQRFQHQASRKDYYKILGVSRDASQAEIKKAFRKKAIEYHPDKYDGPKDVAENKMAELNLAYEVLSDPEKRQRFDHGDDPNDPTGGMGGGNPFQQGGNPFGGGMPVFFQGGGFQFHF